jgi:hypothetical protein
MTLMDAGRPGREADRPRQRVRDVRARLWAIHDDTEALRKELGDAHGWYGEIDEIVSRVIATIHELNREILREDEDARDQ